MPRRLCRAREVKIILYIDKYCRQPVNTQIIVSNLDTRPVYCSISFCHSLSLCLDELFADMFSLFFAQIITAV